MKTKNLNYDLAILGAGPQGLNLAAWIKKPFPKKIYTKFRFTV